MSVQRRILFVVLILISSATGALALVEAGLWISGRAYPLLYRPDPLLGTAHIAGARGVWRWEGWSWVEINSWGMVDRPHALARTANSLRVAVLGDSFTEALQVNRAQRFTTLLEEKLQHCAGSGWATAETLNFGVAGYGTIQEYLLWRYRVRFFNPAIVLLAFFENDIGDNDPEQTRKEYRPLYEVRKGVLSPLFDLPADHLLGEPEPTMVERFTQFWFGSIRALWQRALLSDLDLQQPQLAQAAAPSPAQPPPAFGFSPGTTESETRLSKPWTVTLAALKKFAAEVQASGSRFVLLVIPYPLDTVPIESMRRPPPDQFGAERILLQFGVQNDIKVLAPGPAMLDAVIQAEGQGRHLYFNRQRGAESGLGHLNRVGHNFVAGQVGKELCAMQPPISVK